MQRIPVIYLAFANHSTNPLPNLEREGRVLLQTLAPRKQAGDFNVHRDELISLPVMANYLREYKDQIVLFHFGGHADASSLIFLEQEAIGTGIAELLTQQSSLKLVFLNGCSTQAQVTRLLDLGIPAVIATSCSVGDDTASTFAEQFYAALAKDFTVQEAFDHAAAYLKTAGQTINFSRESRPREAVDANHWGLFAKDEAALNWKLPSKKVATTPEENTTSTTGKIPIPSWLPPWMNKLWVKITGGLLVLWFLIQLLNNITGILADGQTAWDNYFKGSETPATTVAESCGFPKEFRDDSLYILITRFEDYISKNEADCFGLALMRRIDAKNMPIRICYLEKLTPRQRREVKAIQEEHHADLVLWGNLKNLAQGCSEGDICFRSQPSDTIVKICDGEIAPEKADLEYESGISPEDIEIGALHVGEKTFDAWLAGIFNAKVGKKKPEFFVVDESLPKLEQAKLWKEKGDLFSGIKLYFKAVKSYNRSIELNPKDASTYHIRGVTNYFLKDYNNALNDYSKAIYFNPNNNESYINRGVTKVILKDYHGAIDDYSTAIEINPNAYNAYNNRGAVKTVLKDYHEAIDDYSKAIQIDANDYTAYSNRGAAKAALKDYQGAINDFSKIIQIDPNDNTAYSNRGAAKAALKDYHGAINDFSKAIQIDPKNVPAYFNRGNTRRNLKNYQDAVNDYSKAIQYFPKYAAAYINRGITKAALKDYHGAIADYSIAIQINPNNDNAYINRGVVKAALKDYQGAIDDYSKAIQINPNNNDNYNNRGAVKAALKDYQGAIDDFSKAIQINPNDNAAYSNRGAARAGLKDHHGAIADYSKAIRINPSNNADTYSNQGVAKAILKDYHGAIADYSKAIQINPNDNGTYFNRGVVRAAIKDYHGAIADYSKAIQINPKNNNAYNNRGIAKATLKNYQGAIADYSKAIQINPKDQNAYNNRGIATAALKNYQGAIADYSKAIQINPNDHKAYNNRGIVNAALKNYQGAINDYSKSIQLNPKDALAYYNRSKSFQKLGNRKRAKLDLKMARKLDGSRWNIVLVGLGLLIIIVFYKRIDQLLDQIYLSIRHFFSKTKRPND